MVKSNGVQKKAVKAVKHTTKKVSTKSNNSVPVTKNEKASPASPAKPKAKKKETAPEAAEKAVKPAAKADVQPDGGPVAEAKPAAVAKEATPVIPDIKTKTARKYEPDFTKSVLDSPMQEQSGPSQRYSDTDLNEFRELINKKLEAAKKELTYLQGLITRKDEMGGDESDNRYMTMEDGSISMEREQLSQMASRQITFIDHLEKALMRIESKTYGVCRVTGKLIDKARLRAVPHATLSIEAKQTMNR
ncbi:MAG: TraR/DksA family transcriptional regulator [Williamsia sp.]|nr:TraR/DksA family transcriptional regulator [Williamsia sp.]